MKTFKREIKKVKVKVCYTFVIEYEHEKHLKRLKDDLKEDPVYSIDGAGFVEDDVFHYSCKRVGNGKIMK
jgi:hypothetical protein